MIEWPENVFIFTSEGLNKLNFEEKKLMYLWL